MRRVVIVNDKMQQGYRYELSASVGRDFDPQFRPDLTPKQMLELGVFCGKYLTDCRDEYPASWFARAKLSPSGRDCSLNYFGVDASQPLSEWRRKGWMHADDPRGWFQWYCRYYMGRRLPDEDARQIGRWKAMKRHVSQIRRHCEPGDPMCRPRQRQALLHWAYDSRRISADVRRMPSPTTAKMPGLGDPKHLGARFGLTVVLRIWGSPFIRMCTSSRRAALSSPASPVAINRFDSIDAAQAWRDVELNLFAM